MNPVHAIYPGTFDPLTLGHLDIIRRAAGLFPRLTLAVAEGGRNTLFDIAERKEMARIALVDSGLDTHVEVIDFKGLLIDCMHAIGTGLVVRGIRSLGDFEPELNMEAMNRHLDPAFEAIMFFTRPELAMISGTLVRDVARCGGDLKGLVPRNVAEALSRKFSSP